MGNQSKIAKKNDGASSAGRSAADWDLVALTPSFIESEHAAYANAIVRAVEDPLVRNIALSGNYGVGKSSILQQVVKLKKDKVVELSLSTLAPIDEADLDESVPRQATTPTNRIQQEIVKQLLYREVPQNTVGSRFRRIERFRPGREVVVSLLVGFVAVFIFMISGWGAIVAATLKPFWDAGLWIYLVIWLVAATVAYLARRLFHGRVHIKQFSAGAATVTLDEKSVSYFDQYLDEIVYFFETSTYRIVIFEDIDRFNNSHIFETLRSLNTLLNAAPQIKDRPVRFIYAIKDSIFDRIGLEAEGRKPDSAAADLDPAQAETVRANRTKFFDLVIPVVPFITHRSARNLTTRILSGIQHEVSDDLIDLAGRFVPDMRLLKNVRNEFVVFRDRIFSGDGRQLNLSETDLFAMMLYKSTHLSDFEVIRLGTSNLDSLYEASRSLVVANVARIEGLIRTQRRRLANAGSAAPRAQRLGDRLIDRIDFMIRAASFTRGNDRYEYSGSVRTADFFHTAAFWKEFAEGDGAAPVVWRNPYYGQQVISLTRADVEALVGESLNASTWREIDRNAARDEIAECQEQLNFLRSADMGDLIKDPDYRVEYEDDDLPFADVAERLLTRGLAFELVKAGYIDRNFTLYTSTFHGDRVGPAATNFIIHHVERGRMDEHFELEPGDVEALIRERGAKALGDPAFFNIALLDHLLGAKKPEAEVMLVALARLEADARRFLQSYLSAGSHADDLIAVLAGLSTRLLSYLALEAELDDGARARFVSVCLAHLSGQTKQRVDGETAKYLLANYAGLAALTTDRLTGAAARRVAELFSEADVVLPDLAPLNVAARAEFVRTGAYEMNAGNLRAALGTEAGLALDEIRAASREQVYAKALGDLSSYLDAIRGVAPSNASDASFAVVVREVHEAAPTLLERMIVAASNDSFVHDLGDVPEQAWKPLARDNRFWATHANVTRYIEHAEEVDEALAIVLASDEKVSEVDDVEQDARRNLAVTLIAASSVLPADLRAKLAESLKLKHYLAVDTLPAEAGPLFGELRARNVVEDSAATYAHVVAMDWATKEAVLRASDKLGDWVTPELVGADLGLVLASSAVGDAAKRAIVEQSDAYSPQGGRPGFVQIARLAIELSIIVSFQVVSQMAAQRVSSEQVVTLLCPYLTNATAEQLAAVLRAMGGEHGKLAYVGRDKPKIPNTPANVALLNALKAKGVVASFDLAGDPIKVNKRHK